MSDVKILAVSYQKCLSFLVRLFLTDGKNCVLFIVAGSEGIQCTTESGPKHGSEH